MLYRRPSNPLAMTNKAHLFHVLINEFPYENLFGYDTETCRLKGDL